MTTSTPAISVEGLSRRFGSTQALDAVDLEVAPGSVHALLGPNGAGKTTLLRIIVGSVRPSEGQVRVMGVPWQRLSRPESRALIGLVAAGDRSAYHRLSGIENLVFFGRLHGLSKRAAVARAHEVLAQVGLSHAGSVRAGAYSHGMQKRLNVARALLMSPPVLLVDEATHDLDPAGARQVRELLMAAAQKGAAVLWATQRVDEIRDTADLVTIVHEGKIRFSGSVPELALVADQHRYRVDVAPPFDPSGGEPGSLSSRLRPVHDATYLLDVPDDMTLGSAIAALNAEGVDVVHCRLEHSDLEGAFLTLTNGISVRS